MESARTILVVDDSEDMRDLFAIALGQVGYEVETAESGEAGFAKARAIRPALILLDVVLPGMDGLEVLLKLRSDLAPPIPPVILCSGFDLTEDEALRRGAVRFLRKPIELSDLLEAVDSALDGKSAGQAQLERARDHAGQARRRARDAAAALMRRIAAHPSSPRAVFDERARGHLDFIAGYLSLGAGVLALVDGKRLNVVGATPDSTLALGDDLGERLPQAWEVIETGSSLVLPDASAHPFSSVSRALGGVRFFAGAPLVASEGVAVGVTCLFDARPRALEAEDLFTLQLFGRRGSDFLTWLSEGLPEATRPGRHGPGVLLRSVFEQLVGGELHLLERHGGSMELVVCDVKDLGPLRDALATAPDRSRLVAGVLAGGRVAIVKRAPDDSARDTIGGVLDQLRAAGGLASAGMVDIKGGGARGLSAADLVRLAELALDRALEGQDPLRRLVIEEHRL